MSHPRKEKYSLLAYVLVGFVFWSGLACSASQTLTIAENKRLEANIAVDVMNRVAVANDRIANVFGDDGAFVTQSDEHSGQIFIKPSPENGNKPLSITIITENGLTQDLTLNPIAETAATLILKSPQNTSSYKSPQEVLLPGFSSRAETQQDQWIQAMKQAVLGELPEFEGKAHSPSRKMEGFQFKHEKSYQSGPLVVQIWTIKNSRQFPQELLERNFYQPGDKVISLQKRILGSNEKAFLYVLGSA